MITTKCSLFVFFDSHRHCDKDSKDNQDTTPTWSLGFGQGQALHAVHRTLALHPGGDVPHGGGAGGELDAPLDKGHDHLAAKDEVLGPHAPGPLGYKLEPIATAREGRDLGQAGEQEEVGRDLHEEVAVVARDGCPVLHLGGANSRNHEEEEGAGETRHGWAHGLAGTDLLEGGTCFW